GDGRGPSRLELGATARCRVVHALTESSTAGHLPGKGDRHDRSTAIFRPIAVERTGRAPGGQQCFSAGSSPAPLYRPYKRATARTGAINRRCGKHTLVTDRSYYQTPGGRSQRGPATYPGIGPIRASTVSRSHSMVA